VIRRHALSRRTTIGVALGCWIALLALFSLHLEDAGTQWGLRLGPVTDQSVTVQSASPWSRASAEGMVPGDEITAIDGDDPRPFAGMDLPMSVHHVAFRNAAGVLSTASEPDLPASMLALLWGGALLFVVLGGAVYRWSADVSLGRQFMFLAATFATALAVVPLGRMGYSIGTIMAGAASLLAGSSLLTVFLMFPQRLRWTRAIAVGAFAISAVAILAQLAENVMPWQVAQLVDTVTWFWLLLELLAAIAVLGLRARSATDRGALSPLLIGTAIAVAPLTFLSAVPRLLGASMSLPSEIAAIGMAAIPISFAYSILRYQVFGLDVLMRRIVLRGGAVAIDTALFFAVSALMHALGLSPVGAALFATVICGFAFPGISYWSMKLLDAWLYQPLSTLSASREIDAAGTLEELARTVTTRLREILPVQWAACLIHDDTTPTDTASRRLLGADGQLPRWLDPASTFEQSPTEVSVTPVFRFETGVVLLLSGPRLDGGRLDGIQFEALHLLARGVAPSFEAGMLRERAAEETQFRQGLMELARDLGAAATVSDVLRVFSSHAERLLQADSATLNYNLDLQAETLVESGDATNILRFRLDNGTSAPILCCVSRESNADRFGRREERRARELAEHTTGALRRAADREVLEEQLRHRAFYDSLTGLPNRALFLDRIAHAVARSERLHQELAVLFVDLDRFKVVNDSLGHAAGDELLVQVSNRLRGCLRESDTLARLGGDEFTVLLEGASAISDAANAAERILLALREPFVIDGQETFASASIGIAGGPVGRQQSRDLLREADIALYRAKADGRGRYIVYDPRMRQTPGEYVHLETDLHRAIERGELRVHYQPIFSLRSSDVVGMEALLRWQHPEKGMISPLQFIPLAEDTGLIVPIGKWVLNEACRQLAEWRAEKVASGTLFVSVNLSARQLQDADLLGDVAETLRLSGIEPHTLQLEITESVVMQDPEAMVAKLEALKSLGIKLAVDDFGTGYSSLAYLKRFPIDSLKIDRAFVTGVANAGQDSAIVKTVVGLARALGLKTTAEGIEERSQWDRLEQLGCDAGQGFLFSRPLQPGAVRDLLRGRHDLNAAA